MVALAGGSACKSISLDTLNAAGLDSFVYVDGIKTGKTTLPTRTRSDMNQPATAETSANLEDPDKHPKRACQGRERVLVDADQETR